MMLDISVFIHIPLTLAVEMDVCFYAMNISNTLIFY